MNNYLNRAFLLSAFVVASLLQGFAQKVDIRKELAVKKINTASVSAEAVPALLDANGIDFQPIGVVNWKSHPYAPEVQFRIAHTGHAILLHYKVTEASVRAEAPHDNGPVWEDSCVEFFVSPESNEDYYNIECNCAGMLLIQAGAGQDRPLVKQKVLDKVDRWASLGRKLFDEKVGECSWELALVIPNTVFFRQNIRSFDGRTMRANFYKCGDKLQTPHFLSWSPIALERPMFHSPQYFGTLHFE